MGGSMREGKEILLGFLNDYAMCEDDEGKKDAIRYWSLRIKHLVDKKEGKQVARDERTTKPYIQYEQEVNGQTIQFFDTDEFYKEKED